MLAICPNPTIDRLVILDALIPGTVDRVRENRAYPAGKSVSAARGCLANGAAPRVHVLLPTSGSDWYLDTLRGEGMDVTSHPCPGAVRESIIVLEDDGRVTVLNGPGAPVSDTGWDEFVQASTAALRPGEWVICSGSFPPGVGPEALAGLVASIAATGARLALDTGPAWMPLALRGPCAARPDHAEPGRSRSDPHRRDLTGGDGCRGRRPRPRGRGCRRPARTRDHRRCRHSRLRRAGVGDPRRCRRPFGPEGRRQESDRCRRRLPRRPCVAPRGGPRLRRSRRLGHGDGMRCH